MLFKQLRYAFDRKSRVRLEVHDHYGRRDLFFEKAYLIDSRFDDFVVQSVHANKLDPGVILVCIWYK